MVVGLTGCGKAQFGDTLGGQDPGEGPSSPPAAVNLILDSAALPVTANLPTDDGAVTITAVVTDAGNNAVSNATVVFAASSGVLAVDQAITDVSGLATARLGTGGDPTQRDITITATTNGVTRTAVVHVLSSIVTGPQASSISLLPPDGATLPSDADTPEEGLQLTALARDAQNAGLAGVQVQFAASSGLLQNISATTNDNGIATAVLTTGGDPTLRAITVSVIGGGKSATRTYQVVNPQTGFGVSRLQLVASRPILAPTDTTPDNGITLTAFATDSQGNAVANAPVQFTASSGQLVNVSSVTDENGRATATLTTGGDPTTRTINITASIGSLTTTLTPPIQVAQSTIGFFSVTLTASSTRLEPDASSTNDGVVLTATVKDENGAPVVNTQAGFCRGEETLALATTNAQGVATTILTTDGDPTPRDIVVRATAAPGGLSEAELPCTNVVFADGQAFSNPITITVRSVQNASAINVVSSTNILSPEADTLNEAATITAIVLGPNGVALVGVPVTFSTTTGALLQAQARTDENGVATVKLTTGGNSTPRTATVTATADGVSGQVDVLIRRASSLDLSASPANLATDADTLAEGSIITATLLDEQGQPLPNVPVDFSADGGSLQVVRGVTDANGTATANLTTGGNSTPRTINVQATASVGGITLKGTLSVRVVASVADITLISSSPQLPSGASTSANGVTVTAIVKDANGNLVSGAAVTFSAPGAAIQVTQGTTDSSGTATAILTTGGNPANRTVTVTASAAGKTSNVVQIDVVGTTLQINGPTVVGSGDTATYQLTLRDSTQAGISGRQITVASQLGNRVCAANASTPCPAGSSVSVTTNFNGQATFKYTGITGGVDTITANASSVNESANLFVTVVPNKLEFVAQCADGDDNDADGQIDQVTPDTNCASIDDDNESSFPGNDPAVFIDGSPVPLTVHYSENGAAVPGEAVTFVTTRGDLDGALGAPYVKSFSTVTDANGDATVTVVSDGTDGTGEGIITAEAASGAQATQTIVIVSTQPTKVSLQASPGTIPVSGTSTLTAIVRDAHDNLVANQTVSFALSDPTGGSLSAASGVTNSQGAVTVTYRATSTPSANNGVVVTATVDPPGVSPPFSTTAAITVGGQALFIRLGTGNEIAEPTSTTYALPFTAIVTDSAGNPAPPNTVFRLSVVSEAYQRGAFVTCIPPWVPSYTVPGPGVTSNFGSGCPSEDTNQNGILNAGEDKNGNGRLEPGNVVTIPSTVDLVDGVAQFDLTYPQNRAYWVKVTLRATASVAGSESVEETTFVLEGLAADYATCEEAPPGQVSPYGTGTSCSSTANAECSDGIDNDGDGDIDSNDASCDNVLDNDEANPAQCADGLDNDGDGKVDGADPDCTDASDNLERATTVCSDGIDNDNDGQIDFPFDGGCQSLFDTSEDPNPECSDGVDNDADGLIDYPADPSCAARQDKTEVPVQCEDGTDNDGDFHIDWPDDPECLSPEDDTE